MHELWHLCIYKNPIRSVFLRDLWWSKVFLFFIFFVMQNELLPCSLTEPQTLAFAFSEASDEACRLRNRAALPWADQTSVAEPKLDNPPATVSASFCGLTLLPTVPGSRLHHALIRPCAGLRSAFGQRIKGMLLLCGVCRWHGCRDRMKKSKQRGNGWYSCSSAVVRPAQLSTLQHVLFHVKLRQRVTLHVFYFCFNKKKKKTYNLFGCGTAQLCSTATLVWEPRTHKRLA